MPTVEISVIICCYNSACRLVPTLQALMRQSYPTDKWELILVDNCCTDNTAEVARHTWRSPVSLRLVHEEKPGQMHARIRGASTATGALLVFCDDDNWLPDNYLESMMALFSANPKIGAACGVGDAVADIMLPPWFDKYKRLYACGEPDDLDSVIGAGMATRRKIWTVATHGEFPSWLVGRQGNVLTGGDDIEYVMKVRLLGYQTRVLPALRFKHYMDSGRLTLDYLTRMVRANGASHPIMMEYWRAEKVRLGRRLRAIELIPLPLRLLMSWFRGYFPVSSSLDIAKKLLSEHRLGNANKSRDMVLSGEAFRLRSTLRKCIANASSHLV